MSDSNMIFEREAKRARLVAFSPPVVGEDMVSYNGLVSNNSSGSSNNSSTTNNNTNNINNDDDDNTITINTTNRNNINNNQRDMFDSLPDEIILKYILPHLSQENLATKASIVNHRFHDLCMDPILWTKVELQHMMDQRAAIKLLDRCSMLKELKMKDVDQYDAGFIARYALKYRPQLMHLEVAMPGNCLQVFLETLGKCGKALRKLELWLNDTMLDEEAVGELLEQEGKSLQNLTHLSLPHLGDRGLTALGDHCKHLEYLEEGDDYRLPLRNAAFSYFLQKVKGTLKHLIMYGGKRLSDDSYENLIACQKLETLSIQDASGIGGLGISSISHLSNLRVLELGSASYLKATPNDYIRSFGKNNCKLEKLTHFRLESPYKLSNKGLRAITDNCPNLTHFALQYYNYHRRDFFYENPGFTDAPPYITDFGVGYLVAKSERLQHLELFGMPRVTVAAFKDVRVPMLKLSLQEMGERLTVEKMMRVQLVEECWEVPNLLGNDV